MPPNRVHDQVVGVGAGVDAAADLRHPQLHPVVGEHREGETELVAVEGPLRLADHHRGKRPVRAAQRSKQPAGLGAAFPWKRAAVATVEVLGDEDAAMGLDQLLTAVQLPGA